MVHEHLVGVDPQQRPCACSTTRRSATTTSSSPTASRPTSSGRRAPRARVRDVLALAGPEDPRHPLRAPRAVGEHPGTDDGLRVVVVGGGSTGVEVAGRSPSSARRASHLPIPRSTATRSA
ncbi:hypothetical protein NKG05_10615 [Oerskovia sp. M15]